MARKKERKKEWERGALDCECECERTEVEAQRH